MTREEINLIHDTLEGIEEWGLYASDYFQEKHNLKKDIKIAKKCQDILIKELVELKEKDAEIKRLKEELRKNHHRGCPCEICKPNIKEKIV